MAKKNSTPTPKININPLENVKMPLHQAIQAVTVDPKKIPEPTILIGVRPKPLA